MCVCPLKMLPIPLSQHGTARMLDSPADAASDGSFKDKDEHATAMLRPPLHKNTGADNHNFSRSTIGTFAGCSTAMNMPQSAVCHQAAPVTLSQPWWRSVAVTADFRTLCRYRMMYTHPRHESSQTHAHVLSHGISLKPHAGQFRGMRGQHLRAFHFQPRIAYDSRNDKQGCGLGRRH